MTAVRENGNALKHASESLRKDADVVLTAMGSDGAALEYAHNDLLAHSGVMVVRACVRACGRERGRDREHERELGRVLPTACMPEIRWNVAHAYLRSASFAAQFSSAQAAVSKDWRLLEFATDEVKGDKSVAIAALSEDPRAWKFIAASLYSEPDVVACRASSLERVEVQTAAALSQLECQ